ncbi:MAG: hypothetical protein WC527_08225 [Candidatus Margulisiibacteriota bacterium]
MAAISRVIGLNKTTAVRTAAALEQLRSRQIMLYSNRTELYSSAAAYVNTIINPVKGRNTVGCGIAVDPSIAIIGVTGLQIGQMRLCESVDKTIAAMICPDVIIPEGFGRDPFARRILNSQCQNAGERAARQISQEIGCTAEAFADEYKADGLTYTMMVVFGAKFPFDKDYSNNLFPLSFNFPRVADIMVNNISQQFSDKPIVGNEQSTSHIPWFIDGWDLFACAQPGSNASYTTILGMNLRPAQEYPGSQEEKVTVVDLATQSLMEKLELPEVMLKSMGRVYPACKAEDWRSGAHFDVDDKGRVLFVDNSSPDTFPFDIAIAVTEKRGW